VPDERTFSGLYADKAKVGSWKLEVKWRGQSTEFSDRKLQIENRRSPSLPEQPFLGILDSAEYLGIDLLRTE